MKNQIDLSADYSAKVVEKLNLFLSNVQVFYMNVRGFHWNITGKHFFKLHEKFEELYDDLNEKADEIAERILMLEGKPVHAFSEYLKLAEIEEKTNVSSAGDTVEEVVAGLLVLLKNEREIAALAADNGDEGTVDLASGYISGQEKMIWMLNAFLK
ncbi:MAG: DNA starvation/stationary phase protection protein [Mangrovibacterium sp.]|nr:DNA starvation/stationary phase protection protein [Mangrovibacterium sp.]